MAQVSNKNKKASPYKDADIAVQCTSLKNVWHLERTAGNVDAATTSREYADATTLEH